MSQKIEIDLTAIAEHADEYICGALGELILAKCRAAGYNAEDVSVVVSKNDLGLQFVRTTAPDTTFTSIPLPGLIRNVVEQLEILRDVVVRIELPDDIEYEAMPR